MILCATMPRLLGQPELSSGEKKQRLNVPSFTLLTQLLENRLDAILRDANKFYTNHLVKCQSEVEISVEIILFTYKNSRVTMIENRK